MFKVHRRHRRSKVRMFLICCAILLVVALASALVFKNSNVSPTVGTLDLVFRDISSSKAGVNNIKSPNSFAVDASWDNAAFVSDDAVLTPGDFFDLSYTISNYSSISVDVRQTLTVTSNLPMSNTEGFALTITCQGVDSPPVSGTPSDDGFSITYTLDDVILNGAGNNAEIEDAAVGFRQSYAVKLEFLKTSGSHFQGSAVAVHYDAQAKPHRNTDDTHWVNWTSYESKFGQISAIPPTEKPTTKVTLDMVHDSGIKYTYGESYTYAGKHSQDAGFAGSEFIPIENYETITSSDGGSISYCVWDKDKNYLRGSWDCSNGITLDPNQGDAYITLRILLEEGQDVQTSPSYFRMTRNIEVSTTSMTYEIIGDSWSAYDTDIVNPKGAYYGVTGLVNNNDVGLTTDITDNSEMWYSLLESKTGLTLVRNDSIAGASMSYTDFAGKDDPNQRSYITRMRERFNVSTAEDPPDVFFVFGGTNDHGAQAVLGKAQFADWSEADLNSVFPATCYIFDYLQKYCPDTKIVFLMNSYVADEMKTGIEAICEHYDVTYILLPKYVSRDSSHPDIAGMEQIADKVLFDLAQAGIL